MNTRTKQIEAAIKSLKDAEWALRNPRLEFVDPAAADRALVLAGEVEVLRAAIEVLR